MKKDNLTVILVEPQGPLNIGSVCRAMMNFGFHDLRIVNPCRGYQSREARKMALSAQHMLSEARIFENLPQAIKDCHVAFGTTRRFGRYRKNFFTPDSAAEKVSDMDDSIRCALVLGREDNGLDTDELALCQHFVTIPTDDAFPSMNISHALTIFLYEISRTMRNKISSPVDPKPPATIDSIEQMYSHMQKALNDIEFLDPQNPDHLMRTFRRIFGRAALMDRDVRIIRGLMSKIEWVNSQRNPSATEGSGKE
ncbi:TrmH2 [Desulfamplus magnetovallimortis]|uniref:tRNA (cytidine/uridine-2'-O-)-methyltransferase TrmJ n=1 Tax=Desulfamplus magnetovallimortis TaxID=1246637 RepID=A0A1W1H545_9BACT|nr:RNA methyltransferase [Desulfamplus magnetovallimortis]SLM27600.1 TrmH2 [Desulfamplus magnetovallimortis]